uniref:Multimerin 2 n=1 Tax=Poecilia latipinna TaxID=48699 RepID=A0A3B3VL78_9TELE
FVRKSVQLVAEECKTRRHVQNQSPCPRGSLGCQRATVLFRYRFRPGCQKQKEVTTLVWRCCPGHGGPNCDQEGEIREPERNRCSSGDPPWISTVCFITQNKSRICLDADDPVMFCCVCCPERFGLCRADRVKLCPSVVEDVVLPYPEVPAALPVPDMMALVLSQLHPILEGFNRSLERLHHHVGALSQDVAEMKVSWHGVKLQEEEGAQEKLESKLDGMFQQIGNVRRQIQEWRSDTESRLRSQHDELQLNLSSFRVEVDQELKHQQKVLQVRNYHQWSQSGACRLEARCVSVQVEELTEDLEVTSADNQQMALQLKNLEKLINQTARKSQILFMETGLEVEKSKVTVERLVEQLVVNLTRYEEDLWENTKDVDNLYKDFHNLNPTNDCKCSDLNAAVAHLERGVANVTQLANQNRLELEENSKVGGPLWGRVTLVLPLQVKQSVALEQNRTRTLDFSLVQLIRSVSVLQDEDVQLEQQVKMLSSSFQSLLQDAIRHSDVLQLLLGEEVLEFLEWPLRSRALQTACGTCRGRWSSRSRGWSGRRSGAAPATAARCPLQDGRRRCRRRCSGCGGAWRNT